MRTHHFDGRPFATRGLPGNNRRLFSYRIVIVALLRRLEQLSLCYWQLGESAAAPSSERSSYEIGDLFIIFDQREEAFVRNLSFDDAPVHVADELAVLFMRAQVDESTAAQLYARSRPLLAARLRQRFSREISNDAAHDALALAFTRPGAFQPSRAFLPWLQTLALRLALDAIRSDTRRSNREHWFVEREGIGGVSQHASFDGEGLTRGLSTLPNPQRRLVERRYLTGESSAAIAAAEGRTRNAVAIELHRICRTLRSRIERAERRSREANIKQNIP